VQPNHIHKALAAIDLEPGASWEEIVARHKVLVRFWHSDKARVEDRQIADKEMARFNHARDVLKEHYQSNEHHGGAGCLCKPLSEGSAAGAAASDKTYGSQAKSSKTNASQSQTSQSQRQTSQSQSQTSQSQRQANQSQSQASQSQAGQSQRQTSQSQSHSAENSGYNNSGTEQGKARKVSRFYSRLSAENKVAVNVLAFFVVIILVGGSLRILFARAPKPIEMSLPAPTRPPVPVNASEYTNTSEPANKSESTNKSESANTSVPVDATFDATGDATVANPAKQPVQSLSPRDQPSFGSLDGQSDGQSDGQNNLERIKAMSAVDRFEKAVKKNEDNVAELDNEISRQGNTPFRLRQLNDFRAERLRQLDADRASLKEARRVLEAISTGGDGGENVRALELLNRHERRRN